MRLIDADTLKSRFVETMADVEKKSCMALQEQHVHAACRMLCDMIDDAKTIDAEPVRHGQWEYIKTPGGMMTACSECGEIPDCFEPNYCPHCGAKMDGGDSDEEE